MKTRMSLFFAVMVVCGMVLAALSSGVWAAVATGEPVVESEAPQPYCALLDSPVQRGPMSAMFETKLLLFCGREAELGGKAELSSVPEAVVGPLQLVADVQVNNSATDIGLSTTQSETSISVNPNTGTICSAYNDSQHWTVASIAFSGFSRSTNGGAAFMDMGPFPAGGGGNSFGDPSLIWRASDGYFVLRHYPQQRPGPVALHRRLWELCVPQHDPHWR